MPAQDVYLVPAFVGLGAPYWEPDARGALFGLTRATRARTKSPAPRSKRSATRRAICSKPCTATGRAAPKSVLRVDGGMVASDWTMQFLADILDAPVDRPTIGETTALGAAWLAGHKAGVWPDANGFGKLWKLERAFVPKLPAADRARKYAGWQRAVEAVLQTAKEHMKGSER